jgi:hypothetical protein
MLESVLRDNTRQSVSNQKRRAGWCKGSRKSSTGIPVKTSGPDGKQPDILEWIGPQEYIKIER